MTHTTIKALEKMNFRQLANYALESGALATIDPEYTWDRVFKAICESGKVASKAPRTAGTKKAGTNKALVSAMHNEFVCRLIDIVSEYKDTDTLVTHNGARVAIKVRGHNIATLFVQRDHINVAMSEPDAEELGLKTSYLSYGKLCAFSKDHNLRAMRYGDDTILIDLLDSYTDKIPVPAPVVRYIEPTTVQTPTSESNSKGTNKANSKGKKPNKKTSAPAV